MVKTFVWMLVGIVVLLSSGCSHSILDTKDARCPFVERGGCQSMEQVNRMISVHRFTPDGKYVQQEECLGGSCTQWK